MQLDGLVASLAVQAFGAIAEMKAVLGDTVGAAAAKGQFEKGIAACEWAPQPILCRCRSVLFVGFHTARRLPFDQ